MSKTEGIKVPTLRFFDMCYRKFRPVKRTLI